MKKHVLRPLMTVLAAAALTINVWALPKTLIPGGCTVGVKLYSQGLVVTGFETKSAAKEAGLKKGDVIIQVDGETVHTADALRQCLGEDQVVLTVLRNGKEAEFCVQPKEKQLGAYVQDSIAGIGTVTYYDPDTGAFGALGHGVSNAETETLMPLEAGVVVRSAVAEVKTGASGAPGELRGQFDVASILGEVTVNDACGIFGTLSMPIAGTPIPVAEAGEIEPGPAEIYANVSGEDVRSYSVEIEKIYPHAAQTGRNLLLRITDPELLQTTGGIVQGMSGSPIIQNGKIIGAVTHVLVNSPDTGYGIFIENMLDAAG